jgi:hypothetical protein
VKGEKFFVSIVLEGIPFHGPLNLLVLLWEKDRRVIVQVTMSGGIIPVKVFNVQPL